MRLNDISAFLETYKKGTYLNITTTRPGKLLKNFTDTEDIVKHTSMKCRIGIKYDNMSQTINRREEGDLPKENQGLRYGRYVLYPFLIEHNGQHYLRLYVHKNDIRVKWYRDNIEVEKSSLREMMRSSEFKNKRSDIEYITMNVKIENLEIN